MNEIKNNKNMQFLNNEDAKKVLKLAKIVDNLYPNFKLLIKNEFFVDGFISMFNGSKVLKSKEEYRLDKDIISEIFVLLHEGIHALNLINEKWLLLFFNGSFYKVTKKVITEEVGSITLDQLTNIIKIPENIKKAYFKETKGFEDLLTELNAYAVELDFVLKNSIDWYEEFPYFATMFLGISVYFDLLNNKYPSILNKLEHESALKNFLKSIYNFYIDNQKNFDKLLKNEEKYIIKDIEKYINSLKSYIK
ncbi:MAG: hypothetical protein ACTSYZ_08520 [Candidatus Helarchaeota archaeon]